MNESLDLRTPVNPRRFCDPAILGSFRSHESRGFSVATESSDSRDFPLPPSPLFVFPCPSLGPSFSPFTINVLSEEFDRTERSTVPTRRAFPRCVVVVAAARGRSETAPKENSYRRTCRRCETMRRDEGFYRCHLAISIMIR